MIACTEESVLRVSQLELDSDSKMKQIQNHFPPYLNATSWNWLKRPRRDFKHAISGLQRDIAINSDNSRTFPGIQSGNKLCLSQASSLLLCGREWQKICGKNNGEIFSFQKNIFTLCTKRRNRIVRIRSLQKCTYKPGTRSERRSEFGQQNKLIQNKWSDFLS